MTMPLEVLAGPRQPVCTVESRDGTVSILEDGRPIHLGHSLSLLEAVKAVAKINNYRWRMVATAPIWPELADPQRLPVHTLYIPPPAPMGNGWYAN